MSGTIPFPNGGAGQPPDKRTRRDLIINALFGALPAKSLDEVVYKFQGKGITVTIETLEQALHHLRTHADQYGWSVPHVKRGPSSKERCYFAVLKVKDGVFVPVSEHRTYSKEGFWGTVSHIATMGKNEVVALHMLLQFEKSKARREEAENLIGDLEYISKKAKALLRAANG